MHIFTIVTENLEENCYLVWNDDTASAAVVDPGGNANVILDALQARTLTVAHIFITHAHFDHFLGLPPLQEATGAPVSIHYLDAPSLRHPLYLPPNHSYRPPTDVRETKDGDVVAVGTLLFTIHHLPGHSRGACMIACEHAIFSGDVLFRGQIGRVDLPGGSPEDMLRSLGRIARWPGDADVYPGHGAPTTLEKEKRTNPYLRPPFQL